MYRQLLLGQWLALCRRHCSVSPQSELARQICVGLYLRGPGRTLLCR